MCVCICVCVYVCVFVCVYLCVYLCIYVCDRMDGAVSEVKDLPEHNVMAEVSSTGFTED